MNVVLYTDDMEPITVIDIPMWGMKMLREGMVFRVPMPPVVSCVPFLGYDEDLNFTSIATIWAEPFVRRGRMHWMMFTRDEEIALALKSEPLPGQRQDYKAEYKRGLVDGFLKALRAMDL